MGADRISLEDIARKHGTLKVQHGYMPIYERFFEEIRTSFDGVQLLEIGVHEGASLMTWCDYFRFGCSIYGIDTTLTEKALLNSIPPTNYYFLIEGDARTYIPDRKFDIIIDDASHIGSEQIATFNNLWPALNPGGWYVVEDLFAAYDPVWNPSGPIFIDMIQARMKNILIGGDDIQEVHWFGRNDINGILFLRKRYEKFRIQPLTEFNEKAIIDN